MTSQSSSMPSVQKPDSAHDLSIDMPAIIEKKNRLVFHEKGIKIINDDILTTKEINPSTVDLIVTSPPYNVDINYNSHDDKTSYLD